MTRIIALGFALLIGTFLLGWVLEGNALFTYAFFAPKYEAVRRNTFEQSRAFNEGMAQELQGMWRDYNRSQSADEKAAIRSLVQHRVAGYDIDNIENPQLRGFVIQMVRGN
jgi:hypothetical protein